MLLLPTLLGVIATTVVAAVVWLVMQVLALRRRTRALEDQIRVLQGLEVSTAAETVPVPKPSGRTRTDWESLVGTNWLNRLGALMLVIGIVLFVGYSLTQLGPTGKVTIGGLLGVTLLAAGILLEKRTVWRTYSFSLMGAGWAVLYFTVYASWAIPAARVLTNPAVATVLLVMVSAGMIAHSVAYQSETATALAWLLGFVGLSVSPPTTFALIASIVLAMSITVVAHRYRWPRLPVLGAVLVYVTFAIRYRGEMPGATVALWLYWLTFETWDLLESRRQPRDPCRERIAFLANFGGFAGAKWLSGGGADLHDWFWFCLIAAVGYLASAVLRKYAAASSPTTAADSGYELASIAAALMLGGGLFDRFSGSTLTLALLFETELVVLAAIALRAPLLRTFGCVVLVVPALHTGVDALNRLPWVTGACTIAAVLILNRSLIERATYFTPAAALLLGAVAIHELPKYAIGPTLAIVGFAAELVPMRDVRWTGLAAVLAGAVAAIISNIPEHEVFGSLLTIAAVFASQRVQNTQPIRIAATVTGAILLTALLERQVPARFFTLAAGAEGALLLTAGFVLGERMFRLAGLAVLLFCLIRLLAFDLRQLDTIARIASFLLLGVVLLAASWVYTRYRDKLSRLL